MRPSAPQTNSPVMSYSAGAISTARCDVLLMCVCLRGGVNIHTPAHKDKENRARGQGAQKGLAHTHTHCQQAI